MTLSRIAGSKESFEDVPPLSTRSLHTEIIEIAQNVLEMVNISI